MNNKKSKLDPASKTIADRVLSFFISFVVKQPTDSFLIPELE